MSLATTAIGAGDEPVVLLHGFLGSGRNLRTFAQRWSERAPHLRFVIADLRGHGQSPPLPESGASLTDLAADVFATADASGIAGSFRIVGHSLGGRVALAAARLAPERLRAVDFLDITPGPLDPTRSDTRLVLDALLAAPAEAADRRELRPFFLECGLSPPLADWLLLNLEVAPEPPRRVRWAIDRDALARLHDATLREDLWDVVEAERVPLRCIRGERSRYVTAADAARMTALGCPVTTLAAGHFVHVEALEALVAALA